MLAPDTEHREAEVEPFPQRTLLNIIKSSVRQNIIKSNMYIIGQHTEQDELELGELGPGAGACLRSGGHDHCSGQKVGMTG